MNIAFISGPHPIKCSDELNLNLPKFGPAFFFFLFFHEAFSAAPFLDENCQHSPQNVSGVDAGLDGKI